MEYSLYFLAGAPLVLAAALWLMTRIRYEVRSRDFRVVLLGVPLRRIPLTDIRTVHKRTPRGFRERWYNTFKTSHRLLTIERRSGMARYICITPRNRYVLLNELRAGVRRVNPESEWAAKSSTEDQPGLAEADPAPSRSRTR